METITPFKKTYGRPVSSRRDLVAAGAMRLLSDFNIDLGPVEMHRIGDRAGADPDLQIIDGMLRWRGHLATPDDILRKTSGHPMRNFGEANHPAGEPYLGPSDRICCGGGAPNADGTETLSVDIYEPPAGEDWNAEKWEAQKLYVSYPPTRDGWYAAYRTARALLRRAKAAGEI